MVSRKHSGQDLSIFSEMTALAAKHNAVNLSQGFPDYGTDPRLTKLLAEGTERNFNQYSPMAGLPMLLESLVEFNRNREIPLHVEKNNITVAPGASYGIYIALATILTFGDEVIILEPAYDSYVPSIEMNGGVPRFVALKENFDVDFGALKSAVTEKTRAIMVNSPHNPSGKVWKKNDWDQLSEIVKDTNIIILSDEVYDILTYDDTPFYSAFHHPVLRERCLSIFSFGKMFHVTGWKVGYVLASEELTRAYGRVHQYVSFCVNSPAQYALAKYLEIFDVQQNRNFMQAKRNFFIESFKGLPLICDEKSEAGYFQLLKFENDQALSDKQYAVWLTENARVATVPVSGFYHDAQNTGFLRFCFAKKEETILAAANHLSNFFEQKS